MKRLPYEARSVIVRDFGMGDVAAVWTPDPDLVDRLLHDSAYHFGQLLLDPHNEIEVVARIRRVHKQDGYEIGGWLISSMDHQDDYAGPNKREAMKNLRKAIVDYFTGGR